MNRNYVLIFFILLSFAIQSHAQVKDCEQTLNQADDEFKAGRFFGIPSLLKPCLESGFTNEQKVRAYLILTQAYLILDDPISAENSYLKLLEADPEFVANPARDPIDVYYLSKKFTSTPVFTPHVRLGLNTSQPRTIYELNTSGIPLDSKDVFKVGFQIGAGIDWNLNSNWSICTELNYSGKSFKKETRAFAQNDFQELTERQGWFDIPFYVKYSTDSGRVRPFGYIGFAVNLIISAKASLIFDNYTPSNPSDGIKQTTGPTENIYYKRNFFNQSLVFGGGAKYKIGKDFLYADLRYMAGLSNVTKPSELYYSASGTFDPTITNYQYLSDFFRLDNLSVSIGYIHPIYDPRKKTESSWKNLFRKKSKTAKE